MLRAAAAAVCLVFLCACGRPAPSPSPTAQAAPTAAAQFGIDSLSETAAAPGTIPAVVERVSPAVVGLAVTSEQLTELGTQTVEGLGTGVIVDAAGYILTNNHVTGGAKNIEVVLEDGTRRSGELIWSDKALDLAVVRAEGGPYPAAELGTSQNLRVGDGVVAIGTPLTLNFQHTVTSGIVSALRRTLKVPTDDGLSFMEELIQTDAPINPGNSGGPLCDMAGRVVGIATLKVTEAEGIGFAIPVEVARPIVDIIRADGSYTTPYLGLYAIDAEIARYYGEEGISRGIYILNVDPEGPAGSAGIQKGDLITHMDGVEMDTVLRMRQVIYAHKPGDVITVRWERESQTGEFRVTLDRKPVE